MIRRTDSPSIAGPAAVLLLLFVAGANPVYGQASPGIPVRNEIGMGTLDEEVRDHWERVGHDFGLPDPVVLRRLAEPTGRAALMSRLRDLYGASRDILYYRFAPEGSDWSIQGVGRAAEALEHQLDRVSSLLPDFQMDPIPLPENLERLPLDRRLGVMSRFLGRVRGRLNQVVNAADVVDIPLLRMIDSELRTIRILAGQFRR